LNTETLTEAQLDQIERDFELKVQVARAFENCRIHNSLESSTWIEIEYLCLRAVRTTDHKKAAKLFEDALKLCDEADENYSRENSAFKLFSSRDIPQEVISGHLIGLYSYSERWDKEQEIYEKYCRTVWSNGVGDAHLADLLYEQGKWVEARIVLRKVVPKLEPKPEEKRPVGFATCGTAALMCRNRFEKYSKMLSMCEIHAKGTPTAEINKIKRERRARMQAALEYRNRLLANASNKSH
jgi:hypothetical protein